jgi:hypothetical protein
MSALRPLSLATSFDGVEFVEHDSDSDADAFEYSTYLRSSLVSAQLERAR